MAQAVAETLSQSVGQTPMHHEAVGIQAQHDMANRGTEMTPMRYKKNSEIWRQQFMNKIYALQN